MGMYRRIEYVYRKELQVRRLSLDGGTSMTEIILMLACLHNPLLNTVCWCCVADICDIQTV